MNENVTPEISGHRAQFKWRQTPGKDKIPQVRDEDAPP
jgi:hypothetical protein